MRTAGLQCRSYSQSSITINEEGTVNRMNEDFGRSAKDDTQKSLAIDYIKSNLFRVIHADGVIGGITPRGLIHMSIWSERPTIPQHIVHEMSPSDGIGPEIES